MRRFFFICYFLLVSSSAFAFGGFCCGRLDVAAEWLYLLHAIDQPNYIIEDIHPAPSNNPTGTRNATNQNWHHAYRVEGGFALCQGANTAAVRWTHVPSFSSGEATTTGDSLWSTINPAGNVYIYNYDSLGGFSIVEDHFKYHALEAVFSQRITSRPCFQFDVFLALQYAKVELEETAHNKMMADPAMNGTIGDGELKFCSKIRGVGPEFGLQLVLDFPPCIELRARAHFAALASKRNASMSLLGDVPREYDVQDEPYWTVIPNSDIRLGLAVDTGKMGVFKWGRAAPFTFSLEAGYELISYYKALNRIIFIDSLSVGDCFSELMGFHVHGPYVRLGVSF